ncbi:energy transducer TonB [Mucilaginibacter sp. UR6-1]|uniref:energy transducer TonB n=1 Tax=Mucilaginibacter sp. UR6-1 TaxID=1435643 RepID=UPI001E2E89B3|nr:energy transducer TonB [Mucilaginibacter sp. UR6-1]MCC8409342.1 energy transducer TonB [Mucilaginibacter sp. UR6-1]
MDEKKKQRKIMIVKSNKILIALFSVLANISCHAQKMHTKQISKDIFGQPYIETQASQNKQILRQFWIDVNGERIELKQKLDKRPILYKDSLEFQLFVNKNLKMPIADVSGRVIVTILVGETGKVQDYRIIKAITKCDECITNSRALINQLPQFQPAIANGQNVKSTYNLVIPF